MRIGEIGEFNLIDRLKRIVEGTATRAGAVDSTAETAPGVVIGIGDDAAAFQTDADQLTLLTTDVAVEGIHFRLDYPSPWSPPASDLPELIGYRIMVSNVSDIAAMAGVPKVALITLTAPPDLDVETVDGIYRGLAGAGREYGVEIVGGDCSTGRDLAIGVALAGTVEPELVRRRSDAQAGDVILVTGPIGASAAGLEILMQNGAPADAPASPGSPASLDETTARALVDCHLSPSARVDVARAASRAGARAMEDVSDGVAAEVRHIAEMSGLSATIESHRIPIHPAVTEYTKARPAATPDDDTAGTDALTYALGGGEDYELVITAPEDHLQAVQEAIRAAGGQPAVIGRMHDSGTPGEVTVLDADGHPLTEGSGHPLAEGARGYEHFKEADR